MRKILTIFLFLPLWSLATNHYWASASHGGSDGNAGTIGSPYLSLTKFNTVFAGASAGDSLFFNDGDGFPGFLRMPTSGSSGNPIFVGSYGSGAEPIIGGLLTVTLSGSGPNYFGTATGATALTSLFVIDGQLQTLARTPNISTGNYIYSQASSSTTTVFDPVNAPSITIGMRLCVRSSPYTYEDVTVTGVTSTTITFTPALTYNNVGADGYFIIGNTPDTANECAYSGGVSGSLTVNQPSGIVGHTYQVAATDTVIYITGQHIVISGLNIQGGNTAGVYVAFQTVGDIALVNDSIMYCMDGVFNRGASGITLTNCTIDHMGDNGVFREDPTYFWTITGTKFNDIGMRPGMGQNGAGRYQGVNYAVGDSATVITGCTADSIGGTAFEFLGSFCQVDSNLLSYYGQILADCGGIYTGTNAAGPFGQRKVLGNVCAHGGGPMSRNGIVATGISDVVFGIYLDGASSQDTVSGNTLAYNASSGTFNKGPNNSFTNNTYYGNAYSDHLRQEVAGQVITGEIFKHNTLGSVTSTVPGMRAISVGNDLSTQSNSDTNAIAGAIGSVNPCYTQSSVDPGTFRTLASWTSAIGADTHSTFIAGNLAFLFNVCQSVCGVSTLGLWSNIATTQTIFGYLSANGLGSLLLNNLNVGQIQVPGGRRCCRLN